MAKIDILLASYNGGNYIEQQILSIIAQQYQNWCLLIHDDGSSDNTVKIVLKWSSIDSRIRLIDDNIKYMEVATNFLHLLNYSTSDYIMFCDQDDIWFDNKLQLMYDAIIHRNNNIPQVIYSNAYIWKPDEGIKGLATHTFPRKLGQFLFLNSGMQGCTSIFNKAMKERLQEWSGGCAMHDHLLHLMGLTLGEVLYLPTVLMLYRQHDNNVTGKASAKILDWKKIKHKSVPVVCIKHFRSVETFYEKFGMFIRESDKRAIKQYLRLPTKNIIEKILIIMLYKFQLFNSSFLLLLKVTTRSYIKLDD
ncbi:UDP-Glc:alpha-D-GlcNAc-diphosphoundecaprenol beta-1 3-glucosyltransferase [termite gut metagenome]|uniref:UDP-Glc:alpha-D-GlcNAc-diphosphoundecaprenol beta-1 3-glucosyltransferase n=1 Tax=termite gut metagenome TaxID=433724 RepID=A0A5J4R577_9ZZZZ